MADNYFSKNVLIIGGGVSGEGAKYALEKAGARCTVFDDRDNKILPAEEYDLIVISPSIEKTHWSYAYAKQNNIPLIGEIELGARLFNGKIIAITGTNGKTTTTELMGDILKRANVNPLVCGNIGTSFAKCAAENPDVNQTAVVEVSSFQLESIDTFHPHIACILNISPDHLDRHVTMEEYIALKLKIAQKQTKDDFLILSADDIPTFMLNGFCPQSGVFFTSVKSKVRGAYALDNSVYFLDEYICDVSKIRLKGQHNLSNALVAICAARLFGVSVKAITNALSEFESGAHRIKHVRTVGGKSYFNDSKGTNIGAALKAAQSMDGQTLMLLGGFDKGYEFDALFAALPKTITHIYSLGSAAEKIEAAAVRCDYKQIERVKDLREALEKAQGLDVKNILLSPACSSFDMFKDYKDRGEQFEKLVWELES